MGRYELADRLAQLDRAEVVLAADRDVLAEDAGVHEPRSQRRRVGQDVRSALEVVRVHEHLHEPQRAGGLSAVSGLFDGLLHEFILA